MYANVTLVLYAAIAAVVGLISIVQLKRTGGSEADALIGGFFIGAFWPMTFMALAMKWIQSWKLWSM